MDYPPAVRGNDSHAKQLMATYTDLTDGVRTDITVELVTRRPLAIDGDRITRLVVTDENGRSFPILVAPQSHAYPELATGKRYKLAGLLGADPPLPHETDQPDCPDCGETLRQGGTIDTVAQSITAAAERVGIGETLGVIDEQTTISRVIDEQTTISRVSDESAEVTDDWSPMREAAPAEPTPEYVCDACGREVDASELRDSRTTDARTAAPAADIQHIENQAAPVDASPAPTETVGLAAGGAKDVTNFRDNIAEGYTPQPEAIGDEGLFYDYHFETGDRGTAPDALFSPRYAAAVSEHPLTDETEHFLSVGLDSTLSVEDFERPRLDLVAVLDVSGSMDSDFDSYYYDEHGRKQAADDGASTKLEAATRSLCALTEQLHPEDRLGVVLFNNRAHVAKPLRDVGRTDMPAIRRHIQEITAGGGTNMEDGVEAALDMLHEEDPDPRTARRLVFMTDMMPNTGRTGESKLTDLFADAAANDVHTTFIGMGLDVNAELADALSGIRGANHYFIHSASEFERRLGEEFDYMVTPLVYDLDLDLETDGYEIEVVHGSPTADPGAGELMHVGTLFPSTKEDGEARGGVVLVRLDQTGTETETEAANGSLTLTASWTERNGDRHSEEVTVEMPDSPESFDHAGIRKAVALSRYARALRAWAGDVHERAGNASGVDDWLVEDQLGEQERKSVPLVVPEGYAEDYAALGRHLEAEMEAVGDATLEQEVDILTTLCGEEPESAAGGGVRAGE